MKRKGLTELHTDTWVKMYNEGKSIRTIAGEYKLSKTVVLRAIKPFIELRPKSPYLKYGEEWLALYSSGWMKTEIASKYNTSDVVVGNILSKMGVEKNSRTLKYEHLEESFIQLYKDGMSLRKVGEKFGIDPQTVLNYLKRNDIEIRDLSEATRLISFNESYFDELNAEKLFVLGVIYRIGNIIYDGTNPRLLKIMSTNKGVIQYIHRKLERDRNGLTHIQDGKYHYDEIFSIKFISKITEFGFHSSSDFKFPELSQEELECLIDGYIYPYLAYSKTKTSNTFSFPSANVKNIVLDYFERKEFFTRDEIRDETGTSFTIERVRFSKKADEYYSRLPKKYEKRT